MQKFYPPLFVTIAVTSDVQLAQVYALLGGTSAIGLSAGNVAPAAPVTIPVSDGAAMLAQENQASAGTGPTATSDVSLSDTDTEVDAHGHPWSPDLHASTKGKTKDGLWRMKVGVTRPEPKPGFPREEATGTNMNGAASSSTLSASASAATEAVPVQTEEDDEFAAFRAAAAQSDAADAAASANVPARKWTDADLGALCNQAAVKLGDPMPIKAIIADFVPAGEVAHSRNIPEAKREDFAKAVEAKAGIEFAG